MSSLAEALPKEIERVSEVRSQFESLRGMRNVVVEPQIAWLTRDINAAVQAAANGDVVAMLRAFETLKGWES